MYGEHSDGGMTEIVSRDVNFIEDDFPSISEEKQDLQLYELQELEGVIPSLGEGGESQLHPEIAKDSESDLAPNGSKPQIVTHNDPRYLEVNVELFPIIILSLRGNILYVIH